MCAEPFISVVLPCLNEEKSLPGCLQEIKNTCEAAGFRYEIVVADNMSTDRSAEVARQFGARVETVTKRGYGSCVQGGLCAAKGDILIFGDADGSYPFDEIPNLIAPIVQDKADLVLGNRLNKKLHKGAMPFLNHYFGTPALSAALRWLHRIPVYDCNGGLRALRKSAWEKLDLRQPGMEYASEMLIEAAKKQLRYREINIGLRLPDASHQPHLRPWRDGWRHLKIIVKGKF